MRTETIQTDILAEIKKIEPVIRRHSFEAEKNRRLSEPVLKALKESKMFRIWKPKAYGGLETDPITGFEALEALSKIDSAAGWNVSLSMALDTILQWFSDEAMEEVFASEDEVIVAGSWHPPGKAIPVKGGYEVTGQWSIVSGCQYANWFFMNAAIIDGDQPRMDENGHPVLLMMLTPASKGKMVATWDTIGMRGTGSHDMSLEKVFIPEHLSTPMVPIDQANGSAFQGPLYQNSVWYSIAAIAGPALGIARAAIDDTLDLIKNKIPNYTETTLKDLQTVQMRLAEAEATLGAGRAYFYETIQSTWTTALQGLRITMEQRMKVQLATTFAVQSSVKAVNIIHDLAGLTGMRESHPIQRHFRDVNTIRQHAFTSYHRYQAVGQLMLGLEPNWGFLYF